MLTDLRDWKNRTLGVYILLSVLSVCHVYIIDCFKLLLTLRALPVMWLLQRASFWL